MESETKHTDPTPFESVALIWSKILQQIVEFRDHVLDDDQAQTTLTTLAVGLLTLTLVIYFLRKLTGKKKKSVLIIGPTSAGKTTLFSRLSGSDWIGTVTSLSPNYGYFQKIGDMDASHVQLVDLPGMRNLEYHIPKHIGNSTAVIFMIDSADFLPNLRNTAEKMCRLLDDTTFAKKGIPLLLALNKSDLGSKCHTEKFVCEKLRKEIDQILSERNGSAPSKQFDFASLKAELMVAKVSVVLDQGIEPVADFLKKNVL